MAWRRRNAGFAVLRRASRQRLFILPGALPARLSTLHTTPTESPTIMSKITDILNIFVTLNRDDREEIVELLCGLNQVAQHAEQHDFYDSDEWRQIRYLALKKNDGRCQCCGQRPSAGNPLHVDHIKPRSKFPTLALQINNLQVLCADCNYGKSNIDQTDWRQ